MAEASAATPAAHRRVPVWAQLALLVALTLGATAHRFRNGFVWDDNFVIVRSPLIHEPRNLPRLFLRHAIATWGEAGTEQESYAVDTYRPLSVASFFWDARWSGRSPWAYHLTNWLVHAANAALLLALLRRLYPSSSDAARWLAAAFFALAPQLAEGHVWINGRSDPLCALFLLLALHARHRATGSLAARAGLAGLAFFVALLAKEIATLVLPLLVWAPLARDPLGLAPSAAGAAPPTAGQRARALLVLTAPLVLALAAWSVLRGLAMSRGGAPQSSLLVASAIARVPWVLGVGLRELLVPSAVGLRCLRDEFLLAPTPLRFGGWLVVLAAGAALLAGARKRPLPLWCALWFALALAPVGLIATLPWNGLGRYLYVPSLALALGLAPLLDGVVARVRARATERHARAVLVVAGLYVAALGAQLATSVGTFATDERLGADSVQAFPERAAGYRYLGEILCERQRVRECVALLLEADRLAPWDTSALLGAAVVLAQLGREREALNLAATGIARRGPLAPRFHLLAGRLVRAAHPERALEHARACGQLSFGEGACDLEADRPRRASLR